MFILRVFCIALAVCLYGCGGSQADAQEQSLFDLPPFAPELFNPWCENFETKAMCVDTQSSVTSDYSRNLLFATGAYSCKAPGRFTFTQRPKANCNETKCSSKGLSTAILQVCIGRNDICYARGEKDCDYIDRLYSCLQKGCSNPAEALGFACEVGRC